MNENINTRDKRINMKGFILITTFIAPGLFSTSVNKNDLKKTLILFLGKNLATPSLVFILFVGWFSQTK